MGADDINATIDAYMRAFSAGDRDGYLACFAADAWLEDPVGSPRSSGLDEIGKFWDDSRALADSIELRPLGLRIVIGNEAALTMQARPTIGDDTFVIDIIDHMTFDDAGKITSVRAFFDPEALRPADA